MVYVNGEENPKHCPFPLGFRHPAGRGPSHGNKQHAQETDTHTVIDVLITILRHRSRGRSKIAVQMKEGVQHSIVHAEPTSVCIRVTTISRAWDDHITDWPQSPMLD